MKHSKISAILLITVLLIGMSIATAIPTSTQTATAVPIQTAIATAVPTQTHIAALQTTTKNIPSPIPPTGFTNDQIQKAKNIANKPISAATSIATPIATPATSTVTQIGDGFYVSWPYIDTQYIVYNYQKCTRYCFFVNPPLAIPLKTEVWNDNFQPVSNALTHYELYYWNYYTNGWTYLSQNDRYTDFNGITRSGFKIPYKTYSDRYFIYEYANYNGLWQRNYDFFTVSWY